MAACVPYVQWLSANAACRAKTSTFDVRGFGYTRTGIAGLRGLGVSFSASVTPASIATAVQGGGIIQSAPSAPPSTPPVVSTPSLNTTPVYNDPNDPCYIASQTPCPAGVGCPAGCPTGFHSINLLTAPGAPAQCVCGKDHAAALTPSGGSATAPSSGGGGGTVPILQPQQASAAGGFSHWGLLALVAAGGAAIYLVTRKKAA